MINLYRRGLEEASSSNAGCANNDNNINACGNREALLQNLWEMHDEDYIYFDIGEFRGCRPGDLCERCVDEFNKVWEQGAQQIGCMGGNACLSHHSKLLEVVLCTWSAAGLFCDDVLKMKAKFEYADKLLTKGTVVAFQETHDDGDTASLHLEQMYLDLFVFISSALSSAAGGVIIAIRKTYLGLFEKREDYHLIPGRMLAVVLRHGGYFVMFVCVHLHADPNDNNQKVGMLKVLREFLKDKNHYNVFILGDFNFILDQCDRTDLASGRSIGKLCTVGKYWREHFDVFDELHQQSHTRFPSDLAANRSSARLDRIYWNAPLEAFALWHIQAATFGMLPNVYLSDHVPVIAKVEAQGRPSSGPCIPHFVTRNEIFRKGVEDLINGHKLARCCWARLAEMKDIFYSAYERYKNQVNNRGACLAKERIYWSLQAIRASEALDFKLFLQAMEAAPQLKHDSFSGQLPVSADHLALIRCVLQEALQKDDAEQQVELEQLANVPEYERQRIKNDLMQRLARHNPKRRKLGIEAVRGADGVPILDKVAAGDHLSMHWGGQVQRGIHRGGRS